MFELIAQAKPAGGAALDQVAIATGAAGIVTVVLLWLGMGHRSGKVALLGRWARYSERVSGLPAWLAIPSAMIVVSLITALFGMLWDISLHIAQGRDEGPLANIAHYFILAGLFGVFASGFLSMCLPLEKPSRVAVKVAPGWYAPLGGVLIASAGTFALIGFPLDDVWHRLFGQDVTLWGPTHLMLIGGAAMTLIGLAVLFVEAGGATRSAPTWVGFLRRISLPGAFLLGLSTFQAEFDFGVPQFRMVFQPMLIMLAAGVSLLAARIWLGRGAALGAAVFFLAMRGIMALLVGPVLGEPTPYFPLFLVEALIVELVALRVKQPLPLALAAGALLGTVGLAAEWAWTHVFMPLPWPAALFPEGLIAGLIMAVAASCVGAWVGSRLALDRTSSLRGAALASAAAIFALTAYGLWSNGTQGLRGTVLVQGDHLIVRADPQDANWFTSTSWQGGGLVVDRLEQVAPGEYRTTQPIPLDGDWKTMIRLHSGRTLSALPVYLPADPAIPVHEIPVRPEITRDFGPEQQLLQRERKTDVAGWLWGTGYGVVLAIALAFLVALVWGVHRVSTAGRTPEREHVDQQRQRHRAHQHREPAPQQ
ncbi:hypothetical protein DVA67_009070 [Solirubrobacter sp. CPCC 204708]|uniref:Uncharacterized protein n=1 Tax=Solirubrobacter deserti TaxID=2282478 RepID=A0ABT4REB2_9ACTN|nr:hypothetical protein [Solirubrobacter deserti]MBE2316126.1 hypothetical protein [Solirubrobacter deserti]MDA0136876.1 hypothetical protein [Solirubrobacter deserti]